MDFGSPPAERFDVEIGAADVEFFAQNGYLAVDRVTTDAELDWLRSVYDELISRPRAGFPDKVFDLARPYGVTDEPKVGQLLFPERRVPAIRQTAMWNNANRIAARFLRVAQANVENWGHLIFKTPYSAQATPWHQDEAYWSVDLAYHAVGSWLAVDAATIDNGCLWFLPGSHRGDVLRHRHLGERSGRTRPGIGRTLGYACGRAGAARSRWHDVPSRKDMHYAGPNVTGHIRRAWANEYQTAPVKLDTPANRPWVKEGNKALSAGLARRST